MTMPDERARALRFGWEFLLDLRDEPGLTAEQRSSVDEILLHYPSGAEIKQWAQDWEQDVDPLCGSNLAPEPSMAVGQTRSVYQDAIERGPTTPQERMRAICEAYEFFRFGLLWGRTDNLPERLRRQLPYVLRHFPETFVTQRWATNDAKLHQSNPAGRQWLAPDA